MALDPFCQSHLAVLAEKQHVIILHLDLIDVSEHVIMFDNPCVVFVDSSQIKACL